MHRKALVALLLTTVLAACQPPGVSTPASTATGAPISAASPSAPSITAAPTASAKPLSLPRVSDLPLDGTCEDENVSCLGILEAGKTYPTKVFEPTLTFVPQSADWVNAGDTGGAFGLLSKRDIGDAIMFFREVRSNDKSVGSTVADIAAWFATYDELEVTPAVPAKVAGLTGVTMDVRIKPGATNLDPNCPVQVCVPFVRGDDPVAKDPYQWHWDWGSAGTEIQRMYLLDHKGVVLAIFVDSLDGTTFATMTKAFDDLEPTIAFK